MVTHPCRQNQGVLLPVVGVRKDAMMLEFAFHPVILEGSEDDNDHPFVPESDSEVLRLGFQDGEFLLLIPLDFLHPLTFQDFLLLLRQPVMFFADYIHIRVVVPVGVLPEVLQKVHVIQKDGQLHRGHRRCPEKWLPILEDAFGVTTEIAVHQIQPSKLPQRFEVVVGKQVIEDILGADPMKLSPESIAFQERGVSHSWIITVRDAVVVRIPAAVPVTLPLDGEFGAQAERAVPVIREHRSGERTDGVLAGFVNPMLVYLRKEGCPPVLTQADNVLDIEAPYDGELPDFLDDAVIRPFIE